MTFGEFIILLGVILLFMLATSFAFIVYMGLSLDVGKFIPVIGKALRAIVSGAVVGNSRGVDRCICCCIHGCFLLLVLSLLIWSLVFWFCTSGSYIDYKDVLMIWIAGIGLFLLIYKSFIFRRSN